MTEAKDKEPQESNRNAARREELRLLVKRNGDYLSWTQAMRTQEGVREADTKKSNGRE
jgi:hypothetical protein